MSIELSIIIPHYNKFYELPLLLKALSRQTYDLDLFEVVLVDDGSERSIQPVVARFENEMHLRFHPLPHTGNRGRNRNFGAQQAAGERLIFLDSDMLPARDLVEAFERATRNNPKTLALGTRRMLLPFEHDYVSEVSVERYMELFDHLPATLDERTLAAEHKRRTGQAVRGGWQFAYSHSFSLWKKEFMAVGGFDEVFSRNWGAEDIDLGYRLHQNGIAMDVREDVRSYHLWHPTQLLRNRRSLRKNYRILLGKHLHWSMELFVKEMDTWVVEMIDMQEKILRREPVVAVPDPDEAWMRGLPENVLVMGVENAALLALPQVTCAYVPESTLASDKIVNAMGLETPYGDHHFDWVILSGGYRAMHPGLYELLLREAERIGRQVFVVHPGDCLSAEQGRSVWKQHRTVLAQQKLLFVIANEFHMGNRRYPFFQLALAASRRGIQTGIQLAFDPHHEIALNTHFGRTENAEEMDRLRQCQHHSLNILGGQVPVMVDSAIARYAYWGLERRCIWEELQTGGQEVVMQTDILPTLQRIYCPRRSDMSRWGDVPCTYLPFGVHRAKLEQAERTVRRTSGGPLVFAYVEAVTSTFHNLPKLVRAFQAAFGRRTDVCLRVISPWVDGRTTSTLTLNASMARQLERRFAYRQMLCDREMTLARQLAEGHANIVFVDENLTHEAILAELVQADFVVDTNSLATLSPWVLEAAALGKGLVIPDDGRYGEYLEGLPAIAYGTVREPALLYEEQLEPLVETEKPFHRYLSVAGVDETALAGALVRAHREGRDFRADDAGRQGFRDQYDWMQVAEQLHEIL